MYSYLSDMQFQQRSENSAPPLWQQPGQGRALCPLTVNPQPRRDRADHVRQVCPSCQMDRSRFEISQSELLHATKAFLLSIL